LRGNSIIEPPNKARDLALNPRDYHNGPADDSLISSNANFSDSLKRLDFRPAYICVTRSANITQDP